MAHTRPGNVPAYPKTPHGDPRAMFDYIPSTDAGLLAWSTNFNAVIVADEAAYGLTAGQSAAYTALHNAFDSALTAATDPGTRTPVTVAAKDSARTDLVANARQLAQIAQTYPGITPALLADAGLTVPDPIPTPIPPPASLPVISLISSTPLSHRLRFRDSILSNPRSKPPGAIGMELYAKVGTTPPSSIEDCQYMGLFTRIPLALTYDGADALKNAYYIGRWVNAKGQAGPSSATLVVTIAA